MYILLSVQYYVIKFSSEVGNGTTHWFVSLPYESTYFNNRYLTGFIVGIYIYGMWEMLVP